MIKGCDIEYVIENMPDGLLVVNSACMVEVANAEAKKLLGLTCDADLDEVAAQLERLGFCSVIFNNNSAGNRSEGTLIFKSSSDKVLEVKWRMFAERNEDISGVAAAIQDVTGRVEADRTKTEFIANISHELRTPLTTIRNSISNLIAGVGGKLSVKTKEYLDIINGDCQRLSNLINDLIDIAKLDSGKMPVSRVSMDMLEMVSKVISDFMGELKAKHLEISCEVDGDVSEVWADPKRITQVLKNLVSNAIKFTSKGGRVVIKLVDNGDEVLTAVQDDGIGISSERQKHIFTKFYQIYRNSGPGYNGTGLGLPICGGIISMHGGRMWVESSEGSGSKFFFTLPKTEPYSSLYKHMDKLAGRPERFAVIAFRLENGLNRQEDNEALLKSVLSDAADENDNFVGREDDLIIVTNDLGVVFVVSDIDSRNLTEIQRHLAEIIKKGFGGCGPKGDICMRMGEGIYPDDSKDVRELGRIIKAGFKAVSDFADKKKITG